MSVLLIHTTHLHVWIYVWNQGGWLAKTSMYVGIFASSYLCINVAQQRERELSSGSRKKMAKAKKQQRREAKSDESLLPAAYATLYPLSLITVSHPASLRGCKLPWSKERERSGISIERCANRRRQKKGEVKYRCFA